jgi:DNA processing protein
MLIYDIALTLIPEIGNVRGRRLIEVFGSAEAALKTAIEDIAEQTEIPFSAIQHMEAARVYPAAEAEIRYMEKHGIHAVTFSDPRYPERLRECPDAPLILYVRGTIDFNSPRWLSIVGTRKITAYGRKMTSKLVEGVAETAPETVVVSGLAYGTDIEAHQAALKYGMKTVAVLGNPLGYVYPEAHTGFADEIIDRGGAVVSEFHSLHEMAGSNFLRRNRIIAGLSSGTLVVESAFRGGSLSTAACAIGYDRDVMAVPGRVGDPMSEGTNRLIRDNRAAMVTSTQDVLDHLNWDCCASAPQAEESKAIQPELFPELSPDEGAIFNLLKEGNPVSVDELTALTDLPVAKISALSLSLEIRGILRRLPGNRLEKC